MDKQEIINCIQQINKIAFSLLMKLEDENLETEERSKLIYLMPKEKLKKPKEGSITKRADNRFEGRYMCNKKQKSIYAATYDECLKKLNKAIRARDNAIDNIFSTYDWIDKYLTVYKKPLLVKTTYDTYIGYVNNYIKSNLRDKPLTDVKAIDLMMVINSIEGQRTKEAVYNLMSGIFKQAYNEQLISFNPMLGVKRVKHSRNKGIALTIDEQNKFLLDCASLINKELCFYYLFLLYTGCRRSEALNVLAEDIDYTKNLMRIRGTKTEKSNRIIPLNANVLELLKVLPKKNKLFSFTSDYVTRQFKKICPKHTLHDLRHTFATRCLENNVPLKVVQSWLGHSSIDTTADIYMDVLNDYGQKEAEKLKGIFKPKE